MKVYRIEREKYLQSTLSGIGAALSRGFRWNSQNTRLVYTAESRALALLEIFVHLDLNEDLPNDRYFVEIEIPEDVLILELDKKDLPAYWNTSPPLVQTQYIGDSFVFQNEAAVLKVPSAVVADEYNYLINPLHADCQKIKIIEAKPFQFDKRLR
jgi:RES domain-containing protein